MNSTIIVCPVDFSDTSQAALQHASSLARESGAKLYIIHVEQSPQKYPEGHVGYEADLDEYKKLLHETVPTREDVEHEHHYLRGDVAGEIIQFAHYREAGLIVMGTHGRTGMARFFMGSVAEEVLRRAKCPVVTVRDSAGGIEADAA